MTKNINKKELTNCIKYFHDYISAVKQIESDKNNAAIISKRAMQIEIASSVYIEQSA